MSMINLPFVQKPTGYSMFAHEIVPVPRSWAAKTCNLVFFKHHEAGGHFAVSGDNSPPLNLVSVSNNLQAMEQPVALLEDVEGFAKVAWKPVTEA